jgi:signal transduction histidine kinase
VRYNHAMKPRTLRLPTMLKSLSARLLVLTVIFVMLAEVLIFAPSVARFRIDYLTHRLAAAHLAILALEATPDQMVSKELERELLAHVGAYQVGLRKPNAGKLMLMVATPRVPDVSYDLRRMNMLGAIGDAFVALGQDHNRLIRVVGSSPQDPAVEVEVVLDEAPLRQAMVEFGKRIFALSIVISLFTAALVYLSLLAFLVRPMRRITESMIAFREDPEDVSREVQPSNRSDEIGIAQRELLNMQEAVRSALQQKTRLAALGTAVTKINHDLRNILATALLLSDRLGHSADPEVRRVTPTLMSAIERAVNLCSQTLSFTREGPPAPERSRFRLHDLVGELDHAVPGRVNGEAVFDNLIAPELELEADREQILRVLSNLGKNAIEAGATRVRFAASETADSVEIEVADNGPGLPPRARERLFQPFSASARPGGTGLGLAIARDLVRAHGGDIRLVSSTAEGTVFRLTLPRAAAHRA